MFQAWHKLMGEKPQPQFFLRDADGREFGVVEYYSDQPTTPHIWVGLEFFFADFAARRPWVVFDLQAWKVVDGKSKHLPNDYFEPGLQAYLDRWPEPERQLRKDRARRGFFSEQIALAEKGYTIAYGELFGRGEVENPGEDLGEKAAATKLPVLTIREQNYQVDDQYGIRPGEFRSEVSLVLMPVPTAERRTQSGVAEPLAIVNWRFGQDFEILNAKGGAGEEEQIAEAVQAFMSEPGREATYRDRLRQMRKEGVLLGVKPDLAQPNSNPMPPTSIPPNSNRP